MFFVFAALLFFSATAAQQQYVRYGSGWSRQRQGPETPTVTEDSVYCLPCVLVAKMLSYYVRPAATALDLVCSAMKLGGPCAGTGRMFLGALELGGSRHACSLVGLCRSESGSLQVPSGLRPVANELQGVATGISNMTGGLGQSIKQTASGLGEFISGGSDVAGRVAGIFPLVGGPLQSIIGGTGKYFGGLSERLGGGIGDLLDGYSTYTNTRRKRTVPTVTVQEAKEYLNSLDFQLGPNASEVAKGFLDLAQKIKEKTIEELRRREEKEKKQ